MHADKRTWIVVADGGQAKVVEYHNQSDALEIVPNGTFDQPNLPSREIVTDDRGRGFAGKGISEARGAMEFTTDPHEYEEFRFVSRVSDFLDEHVNDFDQLIIAAAPKALGTMRKKISDNVQHKVCAELNKNLTNLPLNDLHKHLQEVIQDHAR